MGRSPRILIEGGIYHVYNRVSRGEPAFRDEAEAKRLLKRLVETKRRDGFQVLAWCLMPNHYHLALRMGEVPLSRSMRTLNQRYAQSFNGRHRVAGPFWQGRYRSKLVEDGAHLQQLILYIHRNPVTAGVVKDVETASRLVSRAAMRRVGDEEFGAMVRAVDAAVTDQHGEG